MRRFLPAGALAVGALIWGLSTPGARAAVVSTTPQIFQPGFALQDGSALNAAFGQQLNSTQTGLTAHAGGGAPPALALTAAINQISVVASANDSVKLKPSLPGAWQVVINAGTQNLAVYPAGADTINSSTGAFTVTPAQVIEFVSAPSGAWYAQSPASGNAFIGSGVNQVSIIGGATTVEPQITVGGPSADTNIGLSISGAGTGNACLAGTTCANASAQAVTVASSVNSIVLTGAATGSVPTIVTGGSGADANRGIALAGVGTGAVLIGGTTATLAGLQVAQTASAVNDVVLTNGATGTIPTIVTGGATVDANRGIALTGNGTGAVLVGGSTTTLAGLQVAQTASRVNDLLLTPGATGTSVILDANSAGADTNAGITLAVKAAGRVTLGAITTCSGTTTATCQGQRFTASVTGLSTAAGGVSATAMTVTDATVTSSAVIVICNVNGYSGTGQPIATNVTPGTGTVSFQVTNIASSGSLNATVPVACVVF